MQQIGQWIRVNGGAPAIMLAGLAVVAFVPVLGLILIGLGILLFVLRLRPIRKALLQILDADEGGSQPPGGVQHIYNAPVTIQGDQVAINGAGPGTPPDESSLDMVGPETLGAAREVVNLADYIEYPESGPLAIRNQKFRNVLVKGPILLYPNGSLTMRRIKFGTAKAASLDSILWPMKHGETKIGLVAIEDVVFEDCEMQLVAFAGVPETLELISKGIDA